MSKISSNKTLLGAVHLLPFGANEYWLEFNQNGNFKFSSFFDARVQNICIKKGNAKFYDLDLVPHVMVENTPCYDSSSHLPVCKCYQCNYSSLRPSYSLYADFDEKKYLVPYGLFNVDSAGIICWGPDKLKIPKNLKQAYTSFWAIPFNGDLGPGGMSSHRCNNKIHNKGTHKPHQWDRVCAKEFEHVCSCKFKDFGKHQLNCKCGTDYCGCKCKCACCNNVCACACTCRCCLNYECGCPCDCWADEIFKAMQKVKPEKDWSYKIGATGTKFTTKHAHGVFYSENTDLLAKVNANFHKKITSSYTSKPHAFVVGFCFKLENDWYVDVSGVPEDILKLTAEQVSVI